MIHKIKCSEIWGGCYDYDGDVESSGIRASLYFASCDGGKGEDTLIAVNK